MTIKKKRRREGEREKGRKGEEYNNFKKGRASTRPLGDSQSWQGWKVTTTVGEGTLEKNETKETMSHEL